MRYHNVLSIAILGHPIRLEFCFHGKIVHPVMNALKNSFEEERQNCQLLQNQSDIFWSYTKITTEDIYFKNFNYKTLTYNLASEVMSRRVT